MIQILITFDFIKFIYFSGIRSGWNIELEAKPFSAAILKTIDSSWEWEKKKVLILLYFSEKKKPECAYLGKLVNTVLKGHNKIWTIFKILCKIKLHQRLT